MEAALYQHILTTGAWVNLSTRAKWSLSGNDRVRYLNGQVTQDIRRVRPDETSYACVTNVKGRIEADIHVHALGESLIVDAPEDLRETLGIRLERYIIADDAVLEDVTDAWQLWHLIGGTWDTAYPLPETARVVKSTRFGLPGHDLWLPAELPHPSDLTPVLSTADVETFRIVQNVPAWPQELNGDTFPPEAGLEKTAMSFTKGCYIGQEVLSRIKTTGKMPRELIAWTTDAPDAQITPGAVLKRDEKEVGVITSTARHPASQQIIGLGYIRQGAAGLDSELLVGDGLSSIAPRVKISAQLNP